MVLCCMVLCCVYIKVFLYCIEVVYGVISGASSGGYLGLYLTNSSPTPFLIVIILLNNKIMFLVSSGLHDLYLE